MMFMYLKCKISQFICKGYILKMKLKLMRLTLLGFTMNFSMRIRAKDEQSTVLLQ